MNNSINPNIQIKRGSYESLQNYNEYIKDGEPIYDKTNKKLKIGTGIHKFSELPNLNKDYTIEFDGEYLTLKADDLTVNKINIKAADGAGIYEGSVSKKENTENTYIATNINKPNDDSAIVGDMILTENLDIWVITDRNATVEFLANIRGPQGESGVWYGSDTPPEGYDVWIDPNGGIDDDAINIHNKDPLSHSDIRAEINQLSSGKVDKDKIFLGIASDGLMHIFINGEPVGPGVARGGGDDVFGYVDENNVVVLSSNLPTGAYTIKYEMVDGSLVDIGSLVLDNNIYYSVKNNLTNCTTNNTALQVIEGESYTATISANSGYELKSVTVTMGGSSVSVTNGVIDIAAVTGDIVITAIAEEVIVTPTYTNLISTLTDIDLTTIYNGVGYKENTRISLSNISTSNPTGEKTQSGTTLLGLMPLGNNGDILHLRGAKLWDSSLTSYSGLVWYYNASGELLNTSTISIQEMGLSGTDANGDATFTMTHSKMGLIDGAAYIRLNVANPTDELIMTRNQLIPQN